MFTKSIRWRLQLWLAFLLVCLMGGFGVTAYQLHRTNQLHQIDQELQRRISALNSAMRGPPPFGVLPGRPPAGDRRDIPPFDGGPEHLRFWRSPPDLGMPRGGFDMRPGRPEVRLTSQVLQLFDEADTNGFYFVVWSRDATVLRRSTNAPAAVPAPNRREAATSANTRMRGVFREAFHFTALGDCILAEVLNSPGSTPVRSQCAFIHSIWRRPPGPASNARAHSPSSTASKSRPLSNQRRLSVTPTGSIR